MFRKCSALLLILALSVTLIGCADEDKSSADATESTTTSIESVSEIESTVESEPDEPEVSEEESSQASSKEETSSVASKPAEKKQTAPAPTQSSGEYHYNSNTDIEDNIFLDAMIYTGYNIQKHRSDGNMWVYILAAKKRGLGYLSDITYGGGCLGYETKNGKPDLDAFKRGGLVCASYVTYVYFNYLPNVAGIDTSSLTTPGNSHMAHDWYLAAKDWVKKGYSKYISFTASLSGNITNFKSSESIPIGSIIMFKDFKYRTDPNADHGSHVCIYAGYKNGYHWVTHVGNANGPEFCAIERMSCGPDPQWPLAVITTPSNIRFSAALQVTATDENGAPVKDANLQLKYTKTGAQTSLGKTDPNGTLIKEGLKYGECVLTVTAPAGYTAETAQQTVTLTTASNSTNKVTVKFKTVPAPATPESTDSQGDNN